MAKKKRRSSTSRRKRRPTAAARKKTARGASRSTSRRKAKRVTKRKAQKRRPTTIKEQVSSAYRSVVDTIKGTDEMRNKMEPPGASETE
ncbi:MAG TPA: hypothetical protein VFP60_06810 [Pseudolabrys sp.]|nr:hypothetical protein [Pseudolabrys sp.]